MKTDILYCIASVVGNACISCGINCYCLIGIEDSKGKEIVVKSTLWLMIMY